MEKSRAFSGKENFLSGPVFFPRFVFFPDLFFPGEKTRSYLLAWLCTAPHKTTLHHGLPTAASPPRRARGSSRSQSPACPSARHASTLTTRQLLFTTPRPATAHRATTRKKRHDTMIAAPQNDTPRSDERARSRQRHRRVATQIGAERTSSGGRCMHMRRRNDDRKVRAVGGTGGVLSLATRRMDR